MIRLCIHWYNPISIFLKEYFPHYISLWKPNYIFIIFYVISYIFFKFYFESRTGKILSTLCEIITIDHHLFLEIIFSSYARIPQWCFSQPTRIQNAWMEQQVIIVIKLFKVDFFKSILFNIALSAAHQIPLCQGWWYILPELTACTTFSQPEHTASCQNHNKRQTYIHAHSLLWICTAIYLKHLANTSTT